MKFNKIGKCIGSCIKFKAKKPSNGGRYEAGQIRCQVCEIYMNSDGTKNGEGIYCRCCNFRVRGRPRNKVYKEKLSSKIKNNLQKICPNCKKQALGNDEIKDKFGFRTINDNSIPQSYCRDCRNIKKNKNIEINSFQIIDLLKTDNPEIIELIIKQFLREFVNYKQFLENSDFIDKYTELYSKHQSISKISELYGIPSSEIRKYVLFDRLPKSLQKAYDDNEFVSDPALSLFICLSSTDALNWDKDRVDENKILNLAKTIATKVKELKKLQKI